MKYLEYITKYWAQITVLLTAIFGGVHVILQVVLSSRYKKSEIKFQAFHDNKINAINQFILCLNKHTRFFHEVNFYDVASGLMLPQELDKLHLPERNRLFESCDLLRIYLDGNLLAILMQIENLAVSSDKALGELFESSSWDNRENIDKYLSKIISNQN